MFVAAIAVLGITAIGVVAVVFYGLSVMHSPRLLVKRPDPDDKPVLYGAPRSSHWPKVRDEHLAKEPRCAACGLADREFLQVHHLLPFATHPNLECDEQNLVTLCEKPSRNCHLRVGHSFNWHAWNPHCLEDAALSMKRIAQRSMP